MPILKEAFAKFSGSRFRSFEVIQCFGARQIAFYNKLKLKRNYRIMLLSYNLLTVVKNVVRQCWIRSNLITQKPH
ncbi:hypothetical protein C4X99_12435 [Leptospira interrogans serovar Geyaweera]|nr:hypothetical protein C4X99_12435 [Leptospira interrogans serovar Geyaweera]QCO38584.1 hypothetical protein E4412_16485 [Leptospira interrogans]